MNEQHGAARWLEIHDGLLRGLLHTLSNRIATVDAATHMLQYEGADVAAQAVLLHGETERLDVLLRLLRTLPGNAEAIAEPLIVSDAVDAALALVAHHNDMHDIAFDVDIGIDAMPVLVDPLALQHALLVAITSVSEPAIAERAACTVRVHVGGTDDAHGVRFTVLCADSGGATPDSGSDGAPPRRAADRTVADRAAIDWLLRAHAGETVDRDDGIAFVLPTLVAARQSER